MDGSRTTSRAGSRLNNMRVGTKIVLAVAIVAVVALVTAGVAWQRMGSLDDRVQGLKADNITRLDALVGLQNGMSDMYRALFLYQGAQSAAEKTKYEKGTKDGQAAVDTAGDQYVSSPDPPPPGRPRPRRSVAPGRSTRRWSTCCSSRTPHQPGSPCPPPWPTSTRCGATPRTP
jgi:chemoreceptor-like protein with four helix bundle sensory module